MSKIMFTNILGSFVFSSTYKLADKISFKSVDDFLNKDKFEDRLKAKYKVSYATSKDVVEILKYFEEFREQIRERNIELTRRLMKESVNNDNLIIQTISSIYEMDKAANLLIKRFREWYELYNPEGSRSISDNEGFLKVAVKKSKKELLKELDVAETMGADFSERDLGSMMEFGKSILKIYDSRKEQEEYLEKVMQDYCPNLSKIAGIMTGGKLLLEARSLRRMAMLPASTIQLLGAEKALFRHLKTGARSPKHGLLVNHPYVKSSKNKGKAARILADKIAIACRVDYFKGKFVADKLLIELEKHAKKI